MQAQPNMIASWLGILVLAALITAIIAAVKHPSVRPWLLAAVAGIAVVVFLRLLAMPSDRVVHHLGNGDQVITYSRTNATKGIAFAAVVLPLVLGGAFLAARRRDGHGAWWLVIAVVVGLFLLGFTWTRARQVTLHSPPVAVEYRSDLPSIVTLPAAPAPVPDEEPVDELWMRLNEPRIQLASTPVDPAAPVEAAPHEPAPPAATAPLQAEADAVSDAEGTHDAAADESSTDVAEAAAHAQSDRADDAVMEARSASEASAQPRPDWVGKPPRMVGEVYRVPVEAGPYTSLQECYPALRMTLRQVVNDRIGELVRDATGKPYVFVPALEYMNIGNSFIDRELLTDQYVEVSDTSVGPMKTAWGLLEFTPQQDQQLIDAWKRYARREGIARTTLLAVLVLALLGGVFALLKIDTWTRGYYTKRLFLGVPAAIIAVIVLLAMANA